MVVIIILMLKDNKMFFNYNFLHFFFYLSGIVSTMITLKKFQKMMHLNKNKPMCCFMKK